VDVKTQVRRERDRTYKYGKVAGKTWKRAMVRVAAGQKIELF
jgi:ribosomal protein L23